MAILQRVTAADWLTVARLALAASLWPLALSGHGEAAAAGLLVAGATDVLDGRLARRAGAASRRGAQLDAVADGALMVSVGAVLAFLHPALVSEAGGLIGLTAAIYLIATVTSRIASGRLVDPAQVSGKLAGGLLYGFALLTLASGAAEPLLLMIALGTLSVASGETLLRAIRIIQVRAIANRARSHAPQAANGVSSNTAAPASIAASAAPASRQITP